MGAVSWESCEYCGKPHSIQAFISHSGSDRLLANKIREYCCLAGVHPLLFRMPEGASSPASVQIIDELEKSSVYLALLGPEVSKRPWTQAWMAFEDGVFTRFRRQPSSAHNTIPSMFLIEDISQSNDAAMPFFETALLIDFADAESWPAVKTVLSLLNPVIPLNRELLVESNRLRLQNLVQVRFQCPNTKCKSSYEILIWMGPRATRRSGIPNPPRRFSIKCSACRLSVNIELRPSESGPPNFSTKTWQPRPTSLPLMHISRLV